VSFRRFAVKRPNIIVGFDTEYVRGSEDMEPPKHSNRLLSYQLAVLNRATEASSTTFIELKRSTKRHRLKFATLLTRALDDACRAGVIAECPTEIAVAGHFTRADLCGVRDWGPDVANLTNEQIENRNRRELKRQVDAVRGTYATTTRPVIRFLGRAGARVSIMIVDTALLAPAKSSLKAIGASIGEEKI